MPLELTLLTKPGCHLCDEARRVVEQVVGKVEDAGADVSIVLSEASILDDAELLDRYSEEIPVLLIDGRVHTIWRVDPTRLRTALMRG